MAKLLLAWAVVAASAVAVVSAQSLGELAKKSAADRAAKAGQSKGTPTPPTKTYTNKDVDTPGASVAAAPAMPPPKVQSPTESVATAPQSATNQSKFEGVYRAAKSIQGATASGVSYTRFRELLQALSTELLMVRDHAPFSERETALESLFAAALNHYENSAAFWTMTSGETETPIYVYRPGQKPDTALVRLAGLYGIPVHDRIYSPSMRQSAVQYKAIDRDAVQYVWRKASETVDAAVALYVAK